MKKLTVRVEDYIYDRLDLVANENKTSINKVIASIIKKVVDSPKEINYLEEINKELDNLFKKIESISKRQYKHFKISSQHFANHGYLSNADINEDKCLNEVLNSKDSFNE